MDQKLIWGKRPQSSQMQILKLLTISSGLLVSTLQQVLKVINRWLKAHGRKGPVYTEIRQLAFHARKGPEHPQILASISQGSWDPSLARMKGRTALPGVLGATLHCSSAPPGTTTHTQPVAEGSSLLGNLEIPTKVTNVTIYFWE